jgi:hypothetical protein
MTYHQKSISVNHRKHMTCLKNLTLKDVNELYACCAQREREHVTLPSGLIERASASTDASYAAASQNLESFLARLSDPAVIELQTLMLLGRGDSGTDFDAMLVDERRDFDSFSRQYIAAKSPLRQYVERGLAQSGATLAD